MLFVTDNPLPTNERIENTNFEQQKNISSQFQTRIEIYV